MYKKSKGHHDDRDAWLQRVAEDRSALRVAPDHLKGDRDVVMAAVADWGAALEHAADHLKGDREVVMTAVASVWDALRFATEELRGDREVVMTAIASDWHALRYATEELRGDHEVVMTAVAQSGHALRDATEELRGDREFMEAALARAPAIFGYRPICLKDRLKPTCILTKFRLCVKGGGKAPAASGARFLLFCFLRVYYVIVCPVSLPTRQTFKLSLLSEVVRGSAPAGLLR